jgi:iron complex outermembrane receptor protein
VRGAPISTLCADGNGGTYTCTTPVGPILYYPVEYINANSTEVKGLEFETRYKWRMGQYGNLLAVLDWTHTMSYVLTTGGVAYQLAGTHGPFVIGGDTGNPRDKVQANFTWDRGPAQVALTFNWISSYNITDPSFGFNDCAGGGAANGWFPGGNTPSQFCKVNSFLETDLTGHYVYDKHWTLHAGILNLFNTQPPVDVNTYGGGYLPYNPSFHLAGAIGRFINIGAKYTF